MTWARDAAHAAAIEEVGAMSRERLTARLTHLAPELTDDALREVVATAMLGARRPLDGGALREVRA